MTMKIDTSVVLATANTIDSLNTKLEAALINSKNTVNSLKNVWQGQACESTVAAYENFDKTYRESYKELISQYSNFLRNTVDPTYSASEKNIISKADQI